MKQIENFNIVIVEPGERYGLSDCLINTSGQNYVEFWDARYANRQGFGDKGQFVSRYYASTLLGHDGGLTLDSGCALAWSVSAAGMQAVKAFLQTYGDDDDPMDDFNYVGSRHHY